MQRWLALLLLWAAPVWAQSDELRVGIYSLSPQRADPYRTVTTPSVYVQSAIYDALTETAPGGKALPALAQSWRQTSDNTWEFKLRPGVTFANGEPLDADAVTASYRWLLRPENKGLIAAGYLTDVAGARAMDALTVEVATHMPNPILPNDLAAVYIVPPKYWAEMGPETFSSKPIGTGPFVVTNWSAARVQLAANPKSWRAPKIAKLRYDEIREEAARLAALQSGAIDVAIQVSPDMISDIAAMGGRVAQTPAASVYTIALITEREGSPFKDARVRQAVNYAVNKEDIAKILYAGRTAPSGQPASTVTAGYDGTIAPYPYDPAKAKALLAEAGYPGGFKLVITVTVSAIPADAAMFATVARDLSAVGIVTELQATALPEYFQKYFAGSFEGMAFQLGFVSQPQMDTLKAVEAFSCAKTKQPALTCVRAVEPFIAAAKHEMDPAKRLGLLKALNRTAHDEAMALFLVDGVDFTGLGPGVRTGEVPSRYIRWDTFTK